MRSFRALFSVLVRLYTWLGYALFVAFGLLILYWLVVFVVVHARPSVVTIGDARLLVHRPFVSVLQEDDTGAITEICLVLDESHSITIRSEGNEWILTTSYSEKRIPMKRGTYTLRSFDHLEFDGKVVSLVDDPSTNHE